MATIAIISQKGGGGKTTLRLHRATCAHNALRIYQKVDELVSGLGRRNI